MVPDNVGRMEDDGERKPFRETGLFKAFVFTAVPAVTAGVVVAGRPTASYYRHASTGPVWALADDDHGDPYHSDPGGEFIRIEPPDAGGTVTTFHLILGPPG